MESEIRVLVQRYLQASLDRDAATLRSCLADEIHFDWGVVTYTDPDDFVDATVKGGVEWEAFTQLAAIYADNQAAVFYEGVNRAEGVRLRTAEHLRVENEAITKSVVVFSHVPLEPDHRIGASRE